MPRVLSYTPPWLNRPAPGYAVFEDKQTQHVNGTAASSRRPGAKRTIARRATEIFVADRNEIKWSDLVMLKEQWEEQQQLGDQNNDEVPFVYRILKAPIPQPITQLSICPAGNYIAISTSHTVHVAILPDSTHLASEDTSPLKLKTFQLGPTAHVLERSPVVATLWHPYGVDGSCLVTVTQDATIRLWELDRENRWSFDTPALAFDLKRLANGTTSAEDFSPSKYGVKPGISPDSFELEVASACFGGSGLATENGWSSMTLWLAMRGGDVYALCPLLPRKWQAPPSLLTNLSAFLKAQQLELVSEFPSTPRSKATADARDKWLEEVSRSVEGSDMDQNQTFHRPMNLSPVPQLQGPFGFVPDTQDITDLTDIFVIAASGLEHYVQNNEDELLVAERHSQQEIPFAVVALASSDGSIHLCLDLDGVKPRWLPARSAKIRTSLPDDPVELVHVETVVVCEGSSNLWSSFTAAVDSNYSFFVTHSNGVTYMDTSSWIKGLAAEISNATLPGADVRLDVLLDGVSSVIEHPIRLQNPYKDSPDRSVHPTTAISLYDSDLGNFLLTSSNGQAQAATLESSDPDMVFLEHGLPELVLDDNRASEEPVIPQELRPAYQPPSVFWQQSNLQSLIDSHLQGRGKHLKDSELRMSSITERALLDAHRTLAQETQDLNSAAADLFRRCVRMQDEFKDQIRRVRQARDHIDSILDDDADNYEDRPSGYGLSDTVENRLQEARERQALLSERCAELRRKVHLASGRPLTDKERAWVSEVNQLDGMTADEDEQDGGDDAEQAIASMRKRIEGLRRLKEELVSSSKPLIKPEPEDDAMDTASISSPYRRSKQSDRITQLLERETALVEAIKDKVARLNSMTVEA